jgi:hypothetical protein
MAVTVHWSRAMLHELMRHQPAGPSRDYLARVAEIENAQATSKPALLVNWTKLINSGATWAHRCRQLHRLSDVSYLFVVLAFSAADRSCVTCVVLVLSQLICRELSEEEPMLAGIAPSALEPALPAKWWTAEDDKALLRGVHKHGFARWEQIQADPLCQLPGLTASPPSAAAAPSATAAQPPAIACT